PLESRFNLARDAVGDLCLIFRDRAWQRVPHHLVEVPVAGVHLQRVWVMVDAAEGGVEAGLDGLILLRLEAGEVERQLSRCIRVSAPGADGQVPSAQSRGRFAVRPVWQRLELE